VSADEAPGTVSTTARDEVGSAVAEFSLVAVVLVPLFFALLQLAFVWHVKATITSAASQGARYAAAYDRDLDDGERRTAEVIDQALGRGVTDQEHASEDEVGGQRVVAIEVRAKVPTLVFWGPSITVMGSGHAVVETLP
jgi:Flp pilus assembly protein TadG